MPLDPSVPLVNGEYPSHASIELVCDGVKTIGCKAISYKPSLKPGEVYGTSPEMIGRTAGKASYEASITLYRPQRDAFIKHLGAGYMRKTFDILVHVQSPGFPLVTDEILGCRITDDDLQSQDGTDATAVKLDLHPMKIKMNGVDPTDENAT